MIHATNRHIQQAHTRDQMSPSRRLPNTDPIDVKPQEIKTSKTQTQLMALGLVLGDASARPCSLSGVDEDKRCGGGAPGDEDNTRSGEDERGGPGTRRTHAPARTSEARGPGTSEACAGQPEKKHA